LTKTELQRLAEQAQRERLERTLLFQLRAAGLPEPQTQYQFGKWVVDFAWPQSMLLCEAQGGTWLPGGGRHSRGAGYAEDCRKLHRAQMLGWHVVYVTADMIESGEALEMIEEAITFRVGPGGDFG